MNEIITRAQAKIADLAWYFTGKPCIRGHVSKRRTVSGNCTDCDRYWEKNNPTQRAVINRRWRETNPDRVAAISGLTGARRRGAKTYGVEGTLPLYAEARRLTEETGVPHHVDHIIPIASGGLHCASNLQVLTATANRRKGNKVGNI